MLKTKLERQSELKCKELELKKVELELKNVQMEREYDEKKALEEERRQRYELEFAEQRAMLELIQKLVSK